MRSDASGWRVEQLTSLTDDLSRNLEPIVRQHYVEGLGVGPAQFVRFEVGRLGLLVKSGAWLLVVFHGTSAVGFLVCEVSGWDSEIFGFGVGRVSAIGLDPARSETAGRILIGAALETLRSWNVRQISARIDAADLCVIHALEAEGFRIADVSVTLGLNAGDIGDAGITSMVRPYGRNDYGAVREIAGGSFTYSRFFNDTRFSREAANELFARWIQNACSGRADQVLVAHAGNQVLGFVSCHIDRQAEALLGFAVGDLNLLGVSAAAQGRGVGLEVLRAGLQWFKPRTRQIEVRTQLTNIPALRLYEKAGFRVTRGLVTPGGVTFHRWLS
ncbi:MAG: GNAT family N-acetyltransferase [Acidobacteria bacterium]|nr:GNAT family N-acetyltransferase [Acidobacteriota bacterium]